MQTPSMPPPTLFRRRAVSAAWWTLVGATLLAAAAALLVDSDGHPASWVGVSIAALLAGWFLVQLVVPAAVQIEVDVDRLRARTLVRVVDVPWSRVRLAAVRRVAGDPVLVVHDGQRMRRTAVPVGADTASLRRVLEERLGQGRALQPPTELRPLER